MSICLFLHYNSIIVNYGFFYYLPPFILFNFIKYYFKFTVYALKLNKGVNKRCIILLTFHFNLAEFFTLI